MVGEGEVVDIEGASVERGGRARWGDAMQRAAADGTAPS
jgi:hypothetical protein